MTVGELIESLRQYDPSQKVYVSENTGNYWRDVIAYEPQNIGIERAEYSEYNRALKIMDWDCECDDAQEILVIG